MRAKQSWVLGCGLMLGPVPGCSGAAPHSDAVAERQEASHAGAGGKAGSPAAGGGGEGGRRGLPPAALSGGSRAPAANGGKGGRAGGPGSGGTPSARDDDSDAGPASVGLEHTAPDPKISFDWRETEPGMPKPCE